VNVRRPNSIASRGKGRSIVMSGSTKQKTSGIRPLEDAELDQVSGGSPASGRISKGVINSSAISLPKPVYPPTA